MTKANSDKVKDSIPVFFFYQIELFVLPDIREIQQLIEVKQLCFTLSALALSLCVFFIFLWTVCFTLNSMSSSENTKDCLACRLVSGFGLIAMGLYILSQSKNRRRIELNTMRFISGSVISVGIARLSNVSFLKVNK